MMHRFIKRVSLFSGMVLLLIVVVECMLRNVPNIYEYKQRLIEKNGNSTKNLILGSSVVDCCVNPKFIADSTYNLAIAGQWYRYSLAFLEKNMDKMPNLSCIIFGVCYHSFWCDDMPEQDIRSFVSHRLYMGIGEPEGFLSYSELLTSGSLSLRKWSKYYIQRKNTMYCDSLGLDNSYHSSKRLINWKNEMAEDAISQTMQWKEPECRRLFKKNYERLDRLSELTARKGIRLIFIIPPVHPLYFKNTDMEQWRLVHEALITLEDRWKHVSYKDYSRDKDFTDVDFYDGNHLNSDIGGLKFSLMVKEDFGLE